MSYAKLFAWANKKTSLPIKVTDVKAWIIEEKLQEQIYFIKADTNPLVLKGFVRQYHAPHAVYDHSPDRCANIYYSSNLNVCWKRFVCCKEMMHIFDSQKARASTKDEVRKLLEDMTSPIDISKLSEQQSSEFVCEFYALHVLFPQSIRDQLKAQYDAGNMSSYDVALLARIPEYYIPFAMGDKYQNIKQFLK